MKTSRLRAVALALAIVAAVPAAALDPSRAINEYGRTVLQDDLPQNTVHTIVQTRNGYIWMGTFEGLVRFDGVRMTTFNMRNTPALRSNGVLSLFEDRDGALWLGTDGGGITVLRRGAFELISTPEGFARNRVHGIVQDAAGAIWFATTQGVSRYASGRFTRFDHREARAIEADRDGTVWVGLQDGSVVRIDSGGTRAFGTAHGLPGAAIRALHHAPDGTLWIGTDGAGIVRMRSNVVVDRITKREGLTNDSIRRILTDRDGNVWIATNGGGLNRYTQGVITHLTTAQGLPTDLTRTLCEDREGSLWVGTNGGGAILLRDDKFVTYGKLEGITSENVRVVTEDRDGVVWIGSDGGGLFTLRDGAVAPFAGNADLGSAFVRALHVDRRGDLWVGTSSSGVVRISGGRIAQRFTAAEGLSSLSISAIYEDRRGRVWIASADRNLHVLENGMLKSVSLRSGQPVMLVAHILEDHQGTLWFSSDAGLYSLRGDEWRHFTTADGLPDNLVFCTHEDRDGTLWIGTTRGISRLRDGRFTNYSVENGLADDIVFSILEDDAGYLWTTSNRGISRVKRADLDRVSEGGLSSPSRRDLQIPAPSDGTSVRTGIRRLTAQLFDRNDGLRSSQCNGHTQPAAWKARDGKLWFGTVRGLSFIDATKIKFNPVPPPTVIEQLLVDGREVPIRPQISLPSSVRRIEIRYTALSFLAPARVRFRFQLHGDDGVWMDVGTRRAAYYDGVAPGRYRFIVQASNNDGVWTRTGASIDFFVATPWWRRWWALASYVLGACAIVLLLLRWRTAALKTRAEALEQRVAERTAEIAEKVQLLEVSESRAKEASEAKGRFLAHMSHELRTPLNAILGFVQVMERTPGRGREDRETLSVITRSGRHLLALINDVLSMAKIEAGKQTRNDGPFDLRALVADVESLFRGRAEETGVKFAVVVGSDIPHRVVGDEGKIRQILVNLLGNAFKFTEQGRVSLAVEQEGANVRFSVTDSGPGLTPEEIAMLTQPFVQAEHGKRAREGTGLGLSICRTFVELLGGELRIESERGRGSRFWFELPLPSFEANAERNEQRRVVGIEPMPRTPRILIADDSALGRLVLSRLLSSVGFEVIEAVDGGAALERWRAGEPDLIFMDMHMPVLDGDDAAAMIREEEQASGRKRTVIIALTASVFEHDRDRLISRGCDEFIAKPFLAATIFEAIARFLGVRYRYEQATPAENAATATDDLPVLDELDPAWRDALREAVDGGDVESAARLVDDISGQHERLADAVRNLLRAYRFDDVLRALDAAR